MTQKIYQLLAVVLFILCAFGWGRLTRRFLDRRIFVFHSLTAIIGLAVLGFIGGLLNLVHLARMPVLLLLVAIGLGVTTRHLLHSRPWRCRTFPLASIPVFVAPIVALVAAWLLTPTGVFNIADDFHTYVTRATRMAQTGSLAGNAFDALGLDSLGSPSFFHCFFLIAGGVEFLNGFDAVACFALCLLLLAELSLRWRMPWWLGLCAIFGLVWINPQHVNISPLYAGAAGTMALMVCGIFFARTLARNRRAPVWRIAVSVGLLTAWLATMKVTLAFFAGIFLAVLLLLLGLLTARRRTVIKSATIAALACVIGVIPWALVAMPALLKARAAGDDVLAGAGMADRYPSLAAHGSSLLFAPIRLFYGDTPVLYLAIGGATLAIGLAGLAHWIRHRSDCRLTEMPALAAAGLSMTLILFVNSHLFPIATAIRYSCPVLIGGIFVVGFAFLRSRTSATAPGRRWLGIGFAVASVSLMVLFNGSFLQRLDRALLNRTLLAFNVDADYINYSHAMLTGDQVAYHRQLQAKIPSGATALVWTVTPFHFDFQRNHLLTMSVGGISSPALHFPAGLPPGELEQYLRNNGVQFVVIETKGYGVVELKDLADMKRHRQAIYQKLADFGTYLRLSTDELAARGKILYSDERMLLFELRPANPSDTLAIHNTPKL